ncbi:hypothetical protein ANCDUO_00926 [Ancylostoma duodenale]|uniref:Peptidase A2 domain-containing protein n=1 Tax=Ancylostoma duodenale TaxID=51022 RepID=A0A0C2H4K0_9BILA|nr:hypothetical protein ANCDUO_00926 [Ancylostoma duodenale]
MLALIDTGAAITMTSQDMTPLLGVFHLQPSPIPCAIGMSGVASVGAYNIILGNDFLRLLPKWHIDYIKKIFCCGDVTLGIMTSALEHAKNDTTPITVRAAQTTILKPSTETFVECVTQRHGRTPLMLFNQDPRIIGRHLMVAPAVISSGPCHVLVTNPTKKTEIIY